MSFATTEQELGAELGNRVSRRLESISRLVDSGALVALCTLGLVAFALNGLATAGFSALAVVGLIVFAHWVLIKAFAAPVLARTALALGVQSLALFTTLCASAVPETRALPIACLCVGAFYRDWRITVASLALQWFFLPQIVCESAMIAPAEIASLAINSVFGAIILGGSIWLRAITQYDVRMGLAVEQHHQWLQTRLCSSIEQSEALNQSTESLMEIRQRLEADLAARSAIELDLHEKNVQLEQNRLRAETQARDLAKKSALLAEARDEALEAARTKSEFLARMSHELRTPLNGVLGVLQILEPNSDPESARMIQIATSSGKSLLDIINNLLDYSKMEAGRVDLEKIPFNLADLALEVLGLFEEPARQKSIDLSLVYSPHVALEVLGDPARVRQLLMNFVGNAVKFTSVGGVTLRFLPGSKGQITMEVSDSGIGIPDDRLEHIFEVFSQADTGITRQFGGTGLGLAICKQICHAMGAEVQVISSVGKGTLVRVKLPLPSASLATRIHRTEAGTEIWLVGCSPGLVEAVTNWQHICGASVRTFDDVGQVVLAGERTGWPTRMIVSGQCYPTMPTWLSADRCPSEVVAAGMNHAAASLRDHGGYCQVIRSPLDPRQIPALFSAGQADSVQSDAVTSDARPAIDLGLRVLLAEDNPVNAMVTAKILGRWGCQVDTVTDGQQAFEAFRRSRYDAIVLDVQMPGVSGVEAARLIRSEERMSGRIRVSIFGLTADILDSTHQKCLGAGMDEVLTKPLEAPQLLELLMVVDPHRRAA